MAMRKIAVAVDEALLHRARMEDPGNANKSDEQVVEDPLAVYLGKRALDGARSQGRLSAVDADRLAVEEARAVRHARHHAA